MLEVNFTRLAKIDFTEIWAFGVENWGEGQADRYAVQLGERLEWLAAHVNVSTSRDDIRTGLRSYLQGQHTIYFKVGNEELIIVRILHQSMDPKIHL